MNDYTRVDMERIDYFNAELHVLCRRLGFLLKRFRVSEDRGFDPPEIEIEIIQVQQPKDTDL